MTRYVKPTTDPKWIQKLPYIQVAYKWNVTVKQFSHPLSDHDGFFDPDHNTIWLYSQEHRIFTHELAHISDGRNYTMSTTSLPEAFTSPSIMQDYVCDEVVAEVAAVRLLRLKRYTKRNAGWQSGYDNIEELCELNGANPPALIKNLEPRITRCINNILEAANA